jgi:very-short-patch-repair endonuclease
MYTTKQIALIASRDLRKRQTPAENFFWEKVKDKKFLGYKFLRQHPLFYEYYDKKKFFIADFYCRDLKLVVEIDGGIHEQQADYDKIRTEILEIQKSYEVIRYKNEDVVKNINKVLINLKSVINSIDRKNKI